MHETLVWSLFLSGQAITLHTHHFNARLSILGVLNIQLLLQVAVTGKQLICTVQLWQKTLQSRENCKSRILSNNPYPTIEDSTNLNSPL
jgi:hypothetical protein